LILNLERLYLPANKTFIGNWYYQQSLQMLVDRLRPDDTVSIAVYGWTTGVGNLTDADELILLY